MRQLNAAHRHLKTLVTLGQRSGFCCILSESICCESQIQDTETGCPIQLIHFYKELARLKYTAKNLTFLVQE